MESVKKALAESKNCGVAIDSWLWKDVLLDLAHCHFLTLSICIFPFVSLHTTSLFVRHS